VKNRRRRLILFTSVAAAVVISFAAPYPSLAARPPAQPAANLQFEALPLERSPQNHLMVRAFINGKPALLTVDTGAPISAIAVQRRAHFGLKAIAAGSEIPSKLNVNGAFNSVLVAKTLTLGSLNLVDEPLVAIDLRGHPNSTRRLDEPVIDGILGADILFPTKAVLDCEKQLLVLKMDPSVGGSVPGFDYRGFRRVPMHVSSGYNLYVDSSVNGHAAKLMVDTGAFATLLHSQFLRSIQIPLRGSPFTSSGVNLSDRKVQFATISRFSIGSFEMKGIEVGVIDLAGLIHNGLLEASPPVVGLLGSETLRRNHGIIDFGTSTLYLKR
jgi:predicted aspartyl protease